MKHLVYSLFLLSISSSLGAITISEIAPVHFGSVSAQSGLTCTMSEFGVISGACDTTDIDITLGEVLVTNLPRNGNVEVMITGSTNTALQYAPIAELTGAKGGTVLLYDNQPVNVTVKGNGADFTITVFGTLTLQNDLSLSGAYTADYTLEVNQL